MIAGNAPSTAVTLNSLSVLQRFIVRFRRDRMMLAGKRRQQVPPDVVQNRAVRAVICGQRAETSAENASGPKTASNKAVIWKGHGNVNL